MPPSLLMLRNDHEMVARAEDFVREDLYLGLLSRMLKMGLLSSAIAVCRTKEKGEMDRQGLRVLLLPELSDLPEEAKRADVLWVRGDRMLYQPVVRMPHWPTRIFYAADKKPFPRHLWGFEALMVDEPEHLDEGRKLFPQAIVSQFLKTANDELFYAIPNTPRQYDVCCFGHMDSPAKNYVALPAIIRARPSLKYVIVGRPEPKLRAEIEKLGAAVTFAGSQTRQEANRILNASRLGLILSQDDGGPRTILESMAGDLPQVVNAKLAVGRAYVTPRAGIVAELEKFPQAMDEILMQREKFAPAAEFQAKFSPDIAAKNIAQIIADAQAKKRSTGITRHARHWWNNWPMTARFRWMRV